MHTEEQQELLLQVQKFYARIGTIVNEETLLTQEEGIKLIAEANGIIESLSKMDSINGFEALMARFEVIKHKLLQAMMTTETQEDR